MEIKPVAYIHTDFPTKFGLPRQSGIVGELGGTIVFEPYFRNPEAVKGLSGYSHIWLLWDFSLAHREEWSATVCPPRLGGNTHVGVWASRSPFRPNSIGLSSVRLDNIEYSDNGPLLYVSGIDMTDGTPIYDIKPYLPDYDSHPDAKDGFAGEVPWQRLNVTDPKELIESSGLDTAHREALIKVLSEDPRPRYDAESDGKRRYGFYYCGLDVRFYVHGDVLEVSEIVPADYLSGTVANKAPDIQES